MDGRVDVQSCCESRGGEFTRCFISRIRPGKLSKYNIIAEGSTKKKRREDKMEKGGRDGRARDIRHRSKRHRSLLKAALNVKP